MLNPDSQKGLVRESYNLIIPNKKRSFSIYRAAGRQARKRQDCHYDPQMSQYNSKSRDLKIYQIFHNSESFNNCIDTKYITRLCLNPSFKTSQDNIEYLGDIKYKTNQISETRAFLHATLSNPTHPYIGFTSHRHDLKFFPKDGACPIGAINKDMVIECFGFHPWVKMISFRIHPAHDFIKKVPIADTVGTENFLFGFFRDVYHFDRDSYNNLIGSMSGKLYPYCNSFITTKHEIKKYSNFVMDFLDWVDVRYGIDKISIPVKKACRSYGEDRALGYICEQLIWYYLTFQYGRKFMMAFIDENLSITYHDRLGIGQLG